MTLTRLRLVGGDEEEDDDDDKQVFDSIELTKLKLVDLFIQNS